MAARHGSRRRYNEGCRCDECKAAEASYRANYRQRLAAGGPIMPKGKVVPIQAPDLAESAGPGPVEVAVQAEIGGMAAEARPGLAQVALAMARILDNPRAVSQGPAAAKVLAGLLDKLHSASARGSRGGLALVREMTDKGGA